MSETVEVHRQDLEDILDLVDWGSTDRPDYLDRLHEALHGFSRPNEAMEMALDDVDRLTLTLGEEFDTGREITTHCTEFTTTVRTIDCGWYEGDVELRIKFEDDSLERLLEDNI